MLFFSLTQTKNFTYLYSSSKQASKNQLNSTRTPKHKNLFKKKQKQITLHTLRVFINLFNSIFWRLFPLKTQSWEMWYFLLHGCIQKTSIAVQKRVKENGKQNKTSNFVLDATDLIWFFKSFNLPQKRKRTLESKILQKFFN